MSFEKFNLTIAGNLNFYYISGTSRGIGKAFAEHLLKQEHNSVIGISRTCTIKHKRYTHITLDLNDLEKVKSFSFDVHDAAQKIYLINNSGMLGKVNYVGMQDQDDIIKTYNVNLIAPVLLTNNFINNYRDNTCEKVVVNISSGAGKNPIDGWSVYCSTKAGIDMYSRVVGEEQKLINKNYVRIFSIAPGIVDTQMQQDIRKSDKSEFSRIDDFLNYKRLGQLASVDFVSSNFFRILDKIDQLDNVVFSVNDYK